MKRKTHEQYVKEVASANCNVQVLEKYIGARTKILHKCNVCGYEWHITPNNILNGQRCPRCIGRGGHNTTKLMQDDYIVKARKINPNIEVLGSYVNNHTKILHRCRICNYEWMVRPYNIMQGKGCPKCSEKAIAKTHAQYVSEVCDINPNIIVIEKYINSSIKILHMCKKCGYEWLIRPTNILMGRGCPKCNESNGEHKVEEYLIEHDVDYIRQYKFNDCRNKNALPFDFYLPQYNACIEYDGKQHYEPVGYFGGEESFIYRKQNDEIKTDYCKDNNILLLRIRYDEDVEKKLNLFFKQLII